MRLQLLILDVAKLRNPVRCGLYSVNSTTKFRTKRNYGISVKGHLSVQYAKYSLYFKGVG